MEPKCEGCGFATCGAGKILKTTDGINWGMQATGNILDLYSVYFTSENTGYSVGAGGTIYKTTNGGTNWASQPLESPYYQQLYSVVFVNQTMGHTVGAGGKIFKTENGGTNGKHELSPDSDAFIVYPNPAHDKIIIIPGKKSPEGFNLTITDLMGKQKMSRKLQNQNHYELDISSFCEGVYLIKTETRTGFEFKKLIIK